MGVIKEYVDSSRQMVEKTERFIEFERTLLDMETPAGAGADCMLKVLEHSITHMKEALRAFEEMMLK